MYTNFKEITEGCLKNFRTFSMQIIIYSICFRFSHHEIFRTSDEDNVRTNPTDSGRSNTQFPSACIPLTSERALFLAQNLRYSFGSRWKTPNQRSIIFFLWKRGFCGAEIHVQRLLSKVFVSVALSRSAVFRWLDLLKTGWTPEGWSTHAKFDH